MSQKSGRSGPLEFLSAITSRGQSNRTTDAVSQKLDQLQAAAQSDPLMASKSAGRAAPAGSSAQPAGTAAAKSGLPGAVQNGFVQGTAGPAGSAFGGGGGGGGQTAAVGGSASSGGSAGSHKTAVANGPTTAQISALALGIPATEVRGERQLTELFDRVNQLLGGFPESESGGFVPHEPSSIAETGFSSDSVEKIAIKFLLARGSASGREIAQQLGMSFSLLEPLFKQFKNDHLVVLKNTATMGDYDYTLTDVGVERAKRFSEECSYFGTLPVSLADYLKAMAAQSITRHHATEKDLRHAFSDLIISQKMFDKLGPAINSGRGMFLFGEAGNGKTSIAERITRCFGSSIWIPKALGVDGDIVRIYDPAVHERVETDSSSGVLNLTGVDQRWIQIRRPTIIAGGELTMAELEVKLNEATGISEAPLQMKSNCGTLVIDDFGRQRMPVDELLNRWIVPLEKRYDFLNLPCGKKIQVPFDQIIIFSTNLEPRDLVDGAFLRRIPYKIQVPDPSEEQFYKLFEVLAPMMGFTFDRAAVDYLVTQHYRPINRPYRSCQPRDILLQVKNFCIYHDLPRVMTPQSMDFAVENYFSIM